MLNDILNLGRTQENYEYKVGKRFKNRYENRRIRGVVI